MPFVNERISSEDKAKIDWDKFRRRESLPSQIKPRWWTIDRDRDVFFLIIDPGHPEYPGAVYGFSWKGTFIRVLSAYNDLHAIQGQWCIKPQIPLHLESQKKEIKEVLKEAIRAYGWNYNSLAVNSVQIEFFE